MKVLMISTDWRIAVLGSREHARMQSYSSVTDELHIIIFTKKEQALSPSNSSNLFVYPTNSMNRWFYGLGAYSLSKRLKNRGITLVTSQDPFETGVIASKIAKNLRVPLQLQLHTDFLSPYYRNESAKNKVRVKIADRLFPKADCIRVVSKRLQKRLMDRYKLKSEPIVLPIHLEIPIAMLSGHRDLLKKKYPQFGKIMVMISRLEPEKNIYMALNAFSNIIKNNPGVGLVIIGDGSTRPQLEKAVEILKLTDAVVFDGWQEDKIPYFLSADLYLCTSNYEGYGRTLMEAGAADCPIVTTDVGIVGEVLNSTNALISPPGDLVAFQNNLEYALKHNDEMKEKAKVAREAVTHYMSFTDNDRLMMLKRSWSSCSKK